MSRCYLTDLEQSGCAHCTGRDGGEAADRELARYWVIAKFGGRCAACGDYFPAGSAVSRDPEWSGWISTCCALDGES